MNKTTHPCTTKVILERERERERERREERGREHNEREKLGGSHVTSRRLTRSGTFRG
jgi:hypothetical protein